MISRRITLFVAVILIALAVGIPAEAAKPYRADSFNVKLSVESGGSMVVTETVRFVFGPADFTFVFRELPLRKIDRLTVLAVEMEHQPLSPGKQPGQYDTRRTDNGRRRITWHFAPITNTTREFTLVYRVEGVVQQNADADLLEWVALPDKHEYPIACSDVLIEFPPSAKLDGTPRVDPSAPVTQLISSDSTRPLVAAHRCGFNPDQSWLLSARFAPNTATTTPPQWQARDRVELENAPILLGIAGLILTGGLIGLLIFVLNHKVPAPPTAATIRTVPPDDLPVAIAGTLAGSRGGVSWANAIGTIFDLARRGVLQISAPAHSSFIKGRDSAIVLRDRPASLSEHEQTLLDILFVTRQGPRDRVLFSELTRTFTSGRAWKRFSAAVSAEMRRAGLIDGERERTRHAVTRTGLLLLLAAALAFGVGLAFVDRAGGFALTIAGALFVVGMAAVIVGNALTRLSDLGLEKARQWKAFRLCLLAAAKGSDAGVPAAQFAAWLPMAATCGVALAWAKRLEKQHALTAPSWFEAAALDDGSANTGALVSMLSTANSVGAHIDGGSGGAGAAAAAGGGASGAG